MGVFVVSALAGSGAPSSAPYVLSPAARAQLAASERQTAQDQAKRRAWLASPDAVGQRQQSRTAYASASADQIRSLLDRYFGGQLKDASAAPVDVLPGRVVGFLNDHAARIVSAGGRHELSVSSYPFRAGSASAKHPVDLSLTATGSTF